jgi:hypothetical protein
LRAPGTAASRLRSPGGASVCCHVDGIARLQLYRLAEIRHGEIGLSLDFMHLPARLGPAGPGFLALRRRDPNGNS